MRSTPPCDSASICSRKASRSTACATRPRDDGGVAGPDGAGDQHRARPVAATALRATRDAGEVYLGDAVLEAVAAPGGAAGAERVRLNDVGAGGDVGAVDGA